MAAEERGCEGGRFVSLRILLSAILVFMCLPVDKAVASNDASREWHFRVLLEGNAIGYHRFELEERDDARVLNSKAEFDVRFLFFNAFSYRHDDVETWHDGCLRELDAKTVTNDKTRVVSGTRTDDAFVVRRDGDTEELPQCIMTFAYWNPEFLKEAKLLNPQTGEYLEVDIGKLPEQSVNVAGESVLATRYSIKALDADIAIEVWYARDDRWIGLESVVKGGRKIRYELTDMSPLPQRDYAWRGRRSDI